MKYLVLALFVAVATAAPIEDDRNSPVELIVNGVPEGKALDLSDVVDIKLQEHVNGEIAAATNLLHPYTAVGIAEAAAAATAAEAVESPITVILPNAVQSEFVIPEPVALPSPVAPEVVIPEPVVLPSPIAPEVVPVVPEPVVLPSPVAPEVVLPVVPEPVVLPSPVAPEVVIPVVPEPVVLPSPVAPEVVLPVVPEPVVLPSPVAPEVVLPEVEPVLVSLPNGEIFNDGTVSVTVNTPQEAGVFTAIQGWFSMVLNYFNGEVQTTQQIV